MTRLQLVAQGSGQDIERAAGAEAQALRPGDRGVLDLQLVGAIPGVAWLIDRAMDAKGIRRWADTAQDAAAVRVHFVRPADAGGAQALAFPAVPAIIAAARVILTAAVVASIVVVLWTLYRLVQAVPSAIAGLLAWAEANPGLAWAAGLGAVGAVVLVVSDA